MGGKIDTKYKWPRKQRIYEFDNFALIKIVPFMYSNHYIVEKRIKNDRKT